MKNFSEWLLEAKGDPTDLNLYTMYSVLRDNGGVVPAKVPSVNFNGLKRCLNAGLLEVGNGGFVPTEKGVQAMIGFYEKLSRSNPETPRPEWLPN